MSRPPPRFARWVHTSGATILFQRRAEMMAPDLRDVMAELPPHADPPEDLWRALLDDDFHFFGHVDYLLARWVDRRGEPRVMLEELMGTALNAARGLRGRIEAGMG